MKPTVQVPIKDIEPFIRRGLKNINEDNIANWNDEVDEFYDEVKDQRWFWIFSLKYPTREDAEIALGKPEKGEKSMLGTRWNSIYGAGRQVFMYRQLLELFGHDPEQVITMTVLDYTVAMSFDTSNNVLTTSENYFGDATDES